MKPSPEEFQGGEQQGLKRLRDYLRTDFLRLWPNWQMVSSALDSEAKASPTMKKHGFGGSQLIVRCELWQVAQNPSAFFAAG